MLLKGWRDVAWREFGFVMAASIPLLFVGYWLLEWLAGTQADLLRLILGLVIIVSSLQLAAKARAAGEAVGRRIVRRSSVPSPGLMGGMFSTAGPPLVYHFYRQPMPLVTVRETLVTVFALNAVFRIGLVVLSGNLPSGSTLTGLFAIPVVMGMTYAARRWPPPVAATTMRRIVFVLLFLSGVSLGAPAVAHLFGGLS